MKDSIYAAPKSELTNAEPAEIYRYKHYVILNSDAAWPARCFKCNADSAVRKKVNVAYVNPWIYLTLLITPIVTIVLALIFQKKFSIDLPICDSHLKKRKNFVIFQWTALLLMIAGFILGAALNSELLFILSLLLLLMVVIAAIAGRMIHLAKFKDDHLWVRGTGKAFLQSLPPFNR